VEADVAGNGVTEAAWALLAVAAVSVTAATAAPPARIWRRLATNGVRVRAESVIAVPFG